MARRSQCSSAGDNPLDPNYLPPHYREEYRLAVDALIEEDVEGYYQFLQKADVVDFLSAPEIQHIQSSVQVPQQSLSADQHFPEIGGDGSSDTYWPIHSDLDAPGLDLGWPQLHPFIGPTEVTTLVNPPEPDMPSIKEQARRLIKNAQQVVAIAMDMFTDVDMFSDILDAATRNVAVYIILDKQNAHHFVNMVSNCRVNLQTIQLLRVRTVSGMTYHCRSGKSFQGQMMDRFLLTDCRAVLSGNYSFMWSYEKLHRCMAHLFLGQLVKTFDEEFRILFAQSHPLILENFAPADEFSILQKRPYPGERILFREQRKFQAPDGTYLEEWPRQSYDDRVDTDWRAMALKKQEARHGPTDLYGRFTPQQTRMDPPFDPGPSRVPMMENLAFKRHSYAEGSPGRYSYPFLQQGQPEPENQGRLFHRGQQPGPGPGKELDYGGNDKFWNQDFYSPDQYSESGLPQEMQPPDNFDPVLNYLSSTRNVDFDQGSEKSLPATSEQPHASNLTDQKQLLQEPNADRKDPMVKRGLRNWRISSYLSAYDNPGEEGLPLAPPNAADPFEEPSNPLQQTPGIDLSVPKIPNVREFKVPAIPRPSHLPSYIKTTTREQPKKLPDEAAAAETTSTPSESSSSTEVEKMEEAEQKELKTSGLRREESFRRKHNAAVQRSSRLRSSLIFSSLEQQHTPQDTKTALDGQDEESEKNESGQTKLPFASHVLGQRRSTPREPFEWSRYVKSATFDNSATDPSKPDDGTGKQDDKDSAKISEVQESLKPPDEAKLPKTDRAEQPPESLHTTPLFVDMNDPDMRFVFFKELAAKRRAAKAAEAEKSKEKALVQPPAELKDNAAGKKEEPVPKETSANISDTSEGLLPKNAGAEDAGKTVSTVSLTSDASDQKSKHASQVKTDPDASQSRRQERTKDSADSAKAELKNSQSVASLRVSAETGAPQSKPPEQPKPTTPAVKSPHTPASAPPASAPPVAQGSESPRIDSNSKESGSITPSSAEVTPSPSSASAAKLPESLQLGTSISSPPPLPEQQTRSDLGSSKPSVQSPSADHIRPDSGSQISSPSSSAPLSSPEETKSPKVTLEDSSSTITLSTSSPNAQECVLPSTPEHSTSSETLSAAHSAGSEPDKSSSQSSMKKDIPASEKISVPANREKSEDIKAVSPCLPKASDLEGKSAQNETITPTPLAPEAPPKHSGTSSPVQPDSTSAAPQSERQATPPSQLNLTGSVTPAKTVSSPPTESHGSVLSPEAEKTLQSPSDTKQSPTNTTNTPPLPSGPAQPTSTVPTEPTSTVPTEPTSTVPAGPTSKFPTGPTSTVPTEPTSTVPTEPTSKVPTEPTSTVPIEPTSKVPTEPTSTVPTEPTSTVPTGPTSKVPTGPTSTVPTGPTSTVPTEPTSTVPKEPTSTVPKEPTSTVPKEPTSTVPTEPTSTVPTGPTSTVPSGPTSKVPTEPTSTVPTEPTFTVPTEPTSTVPTKPTSTVPTEPTSTVPTEPTSTVLAEHTSKVPTEPTSTVPTGPTSKVQAELDLACKTPQSVTSEPRPSEPPVSAENGKTDTPEPSERKHDDTEAINEANKPNEKTIERVEQNNCSDRPETASDEVVPPSPQSKQPKSRYQSSTANVLSSSNLRDDTKLLLGQISANNQSRNEAAKELPVTDDEKEDEADKNAKREKQRGIGSLNRGDPKMTQEREKLLERIQSMRKERKVYSRFEMAP